MVVVVWLVSSISSTDTSNAVGSVVMDAVVLVIGCIVRVMGSNVLMRSLELLVFVLVVTVLLLLVGRTRLRSCVCGTDCVVDTWDMIAEKDAFGGWLGGGGMGSCCRWLQLTQ